MKKLSLFLTALILASLTGCSDKNNDPSPSEPVENTVSETSSVTSEKAPEVSDGGQASEAPEKIPETHGFREMKADQFSEVNVTLSRQDGEPPLDIKEYNWEWFDVGTELSPCVAGDNFDRSVENFMDYYRKYERQFIPDYNAMKDTEDEGDINYNCAMNGTDIYLSASYDKMCTWLVGSHCIKVFKVNAENKTSEVIWEYFGEDLDKRISISSMAYHNGELWIVYEIYTGNDDYIFSRDDIESHMISVNTETKEVTDHTDSLLIFDVNYPFLLDTPYEKLVGIYYGSDGHYYSEFDDETGQWEIISEADEEICFYDNGYVRATKTDSGSVAECDDFRFEYNIKGAEVFAASKDAIFLKVEDVSGSVLYAYNFNKMECCKMSVTGLGESAFAIGENLLISQQGRTQNFLIPELGASFCINSAASTSDLMPFDSSVGFITNRDYYHTAAIGTDQNTERKVFIVSGK